MEASPSLPAVGGAGGDAVRREVREWKGRSPLLSSPLLPNPGFIFSRNPWGPGGSPQPCMHKYGTVRRCYLLLLLRLLFLTPDHTLIFFLGKSEHWQKPKNVLLLHPFTSLRWDSGALARRRQQVLQLPAEKRKTETAKWNLAVNTNESERRRRGLCINSCICRDDAVRYTLSWEHLHSCRMDFL